MDLSISAWWWIAAGVAVAVELATGTFYLLMIALGLAGGGIAAWLGLSSVIQVLGAALIGGGATALLHTYRRRQPSEPAARENRDVNLDIGEEVEVSRWADDRTARVPYRGSAWTARLAPDAAARPGRFRVVAVERNWLVVAPSVPL